MNQPNQNEFNEFRNYILSRIKKNLTRGRFEHTLRVEQTAISLASKFNGNLKEVAIAALLHDNAKDLSDSMKLKLCKKYQIQLSLAEQSNIDLVHAKLGAEIVKNRYKVSAADIINAVKYHTTGRPNMSLTEKIIYIADFIEPGRVEFPGLLAVRKTAMQDLDLALIKILKLTIDYVKSRQLILDPTTEKTYEYYRAKVHQ